jgi:hypothetical protein
MTLRDLPSDIRKLSCDPKGFWKTWQQEILNLQCDWRTAAKELLLHAEVKTVSGVQSADFD